MKIATSELFLLPSGHFIGTEDEDFYLLYAPLSQDICFMEKKDAEALSNYLERQVIPVDAELKELGDHLVSVNQLPPVVSPSVRTTTHMSLMPNYFCNLSCIYCYSAKGRSRIAISRKKVIGVLNYFIDSHRISNSLPLSLFISGGGEPLLSWDIVSQAIEYARERARSQGISLRISLVTNGTLLTAEIAQWLKERDCFVCVSFEVLEDLQNRQRGQFVKVKQSLKILERAGVATMINATITPVSVSRMVEMTEEIIRCYSFVKQVTMEPVTSISLFPTPQVMRHFYDTFLTEYRKSKELATKCGLNLRFEMDEALDGTVIRHCPGKFCLTAEGTISACHLATSPKEERYAKCVYGGVKENGNVEIDDEKFRQLFDDNMLTKHHCDDCFARWNCGGECMARNDTYPREFMDEVCRFNRLWLMYLLKERLEKEMQEQYGLTLREVALQDEIVVLREKEIYVLPADQNQWLLYAPLADSAALLTFSDIRRLGRTAISQDSDTNACDVDEEASELLSELTDVVPIAEREGYVRTVNDFVNLSILPNNVCNFSCAYCYSGKGRSAQQLSFEKARAMVDFFLSPKRNIDKKLTVSIFGGGEPLLSWSDVVKPLLLYIADIASKQKRHIIMTLITNGSLLPNDFLSMCLTYNVDLVVSYEVLREVQDQQRQHFDLVTNNIRQMINAGIIPAINTVVTQINVTKIEETVERLHNVFPEIKYLSMEPVIDSAMQNKHEFYSLFITHFMQAKNKADQFGIAISCSATRKVDQTIDRYCAGELALCADGSLSICPCVSSSAEPFYHSYVYGHVSEDGTVDIDHQRLSQLLGINIGSHPWCKSCFAKWNCAGGCLNTFTQNEGQQDKDFCWFTREITRRIILERLKKEQEES